MVLKEMEFEYQTIMDLIEKHLKEKKSNGFRGNGTKGKKLICISRKYI